MNDLKLIKNKYYLVKILQHKNPKLIGKKVTVKFTGILLRSLTTNEYLYLAQVKVIKETEAPGNKESSIKNQSSELAL